MGDTNVNDDMKVPKSADDACSVKYNENSDNLGSDIKKTRNGIVLMPQPSANSRDPLNWPFKKKVIITATLFLALFAGLSAPFCGQLNLKQQAALYGKTTIQITYFNSASLAGLACGGFFWLPLSHKFGRSSMIFWAQLGCLITQVWAASMTHSDEYVAYFMSRYFSGFFGIIVSVLGPQYLVEIFFLHQRGRAFTILLLALEFGINAGPTFSGYVSGATVWTVEYWWSVGLLGATSILVFCFLEETSFDREDSDSNIIPPQNFFKNRIHTFFPGTKIVKSVSIREMITAFIMPFKIILSPVVLLILAHDTITFAFNIGVNALTPIWLQTPTKFGGYGFTVSQNASFSFVHWIGLFFCILYNSFFSDRIPLWLTARNNGIWKPEYRLHALWIPSFISLPLGLGIFGAALQYHLHWIVIALGSILVAFGALSSISVTTNYICECFRSHTIEVAVPVASIRLCLGLSIPFFINSWIAAVDLGWVFGMMAFFVLAAFILLGVLMWKGHLIREWTPFGLGSSEEGEQVVSKDVASLGSDGI